MPVRLLLLVVAKDFKTRLAPVSCGLVSRCLAGLIDVGVLLIDRRILLHEQGLVAVYLLRDSLKVIRPA